jgi:hypothetical protein
MPSEAPYLDPKDIKRRSPQAGRNVIDRAFELAAAKEREAAERAEALRKAYEERSAFAARTKNLFDQLKSGIDVDGSADRGVEVYITKQQGVIDMGLKADDLSNVPIGPFLVLAATHAASDREFLGNEAFDAHLRPETEARAKDADEFFLRGAKMAFGDDPIPLNGISIKLGGMARGLDVLKTPGMSPSVKLALESIRSTAPRLIKDDPAALLDQIQKLASLDSLNGYVMEYNERVLLPALAKESLAQEERKNLLWDAQRLAKMLYELRLIEDTLKKSVPRDVNPSKQERDAAERLRERIQDQAVKNAATYTPTPKLEAPSAKPPIAPAASRTAEKPRTIDSDAEKREKERLIEEVMSQGAFEVHTSLTNFEGTTHAGFQDIGDTRWKHAFNASTFDRTARAESVWFERGGGPRGPGVLQERGISEMVTIEPLTKHEYRNEEYEISAGGLRGIFGGKKTETKKVRYETSVDDISSVLPGHAMHEPACLVIYETVNREYKDYSTRNGNILKVSMVVPKSVAEKLAALGKRDPALFRTLAEKITTERTGVITREMWNTGQGNTSKKERTISEEEQQYYRVRPPYEMWKAVQGGVERMLIQNRLNSKIDRGLFKESDVVEFL